MDGSEFKFESVHLLYYHLHETSLKRGKSYIESPGWLKNKRATKIQKIMIIIVSSML